MAYSEETLKKFFDTMGEYIRDYRKQIENGEFLKLSISAKNSKIGETPSVSQAAVFTCPNCDQCKWLCYDIRDSFKFGWNSTTMKARARNTALLLYAIDEYFKQWNEFLDKTKKRFVRYHVGGEITGKKHFEYMIDAVKRHPHITFWTYTKNYKIVNDYVRDHGGSIEAAIPANFSIMFSEWDGMPIDNPYGFPIFTCVLKNGNKNHEKEFFDKLHTCPGKCKICIESGNGCPFRKSAKVLEH